MKKIFYLVSIGFFMLQSCSSGDNNNATDNNPTYTPGPDVIDIEGNLYQTVTNCNQTWTRTNLNVSKYRNGDVIPQVTDPTVWANLTTGAWCYYNNDPANGVIYGKLYNWYAINDSRGLAPIGYHIPSEVEWNTLKTCVGGAKAGFNMKETGTAHWLTNDPNVTNSSGFTGLPGGQFDVFFDEIGNKGYWWSSSAFDTSRSWSFSISYSSSLGQSAYRKNFGFSVRCVKD